MNLSTRRHFFTSIHLTASQHENEATWSFLTSLGTCSLECICRNKRMNSNQHLHHIHTMWWECGGPSLQMVPLKRLWKGSSKKQCSKIQQWTHLHLMHTSEKEHREIVQFKSNTKDKAMNKTFRELHRICLIVLETVPTVVPQENSQRQPGLTKAEDSAGTLW